MAHINNVKAKGPTGENQEQPTPNIAVKALRSGIFDYIESIHIGEHLHSYLFNDIELAVDEFDEDLTDEQKRVLVEYLYDFLPDFEAAAIDEIYRVSRKIEQEVGAFFDNLKQEKEHCHDG